MKIPCGNRNSVEIILLEKFMEEIIMDDFRNSLDESSISIGRVN